MILLVELFYCFMILFTGAICLSWFWMRRNLPWKGRQWVLWLVNTLVLTAGFYHVLFGLCKLFYTLACAKDLLS